MRSMRENPGRYQNSNELWIRRPVSASLISPGILDILIPTLESEGIWVQDPNTGRIWLSSQGRFAVRKLVDDEKARRLKGRTRWVTTLILPLLAGLVGIIGALTGLIAVWQHGK